MKKLKKIDVVKMNVRFLYNLINLIKGSKIEKIINNWIILKFLK